MNFFKRKVKVYSKKKLPRMLSEKISIKVKITYYWGLYFFLELWDNFCQKHLADLNWVLKNLQKWEIIDNTIFFIILICSKPVWTAAELYYSKSIQKYLKALISKHPLLQNLQNYLEVLCFIPFRPSCEKSSNFLPYP